MPDRIDALRGHDRQLRAFRGQVLEGALDDELQEIVREAAGQLETPIALVTLVLDRIQFCRAHHGLDADLAAVQATSRDTSFCQFVVRDDAPFEVNDAPLDDRVPQGLVDHYGLRAYLGVPIRVDDEVLGALCVVDTTPKAFTTAHHAHLRRLANQVELRLTRLAASGAQTSLGLLEAAVGPVLAHLRNELTPLHYVVEEAREATLEMRAALAALRRGDAYLQQTLPSLESALDIITETLAIVDASRHGMIDGLTALQASATTDVRARTIRQALEHGAALAHHVTQHVGGIEWTDVDVAPIPDLPPPIVGAIISAVLSQLADQLRRRGLAGPIRGSARPVDGALVLDFAVAGLTDDDAHALRRHLNRVGLSRDLVRLVFEPPHLRVTLVGAPREPG